MLQMVYSVRSERLLMEEIDYTPVPPARAAPAAADYAPDAQVTGAGFAAGSCLEARPPDLVCRFLGQQTSRYRASIFRNST
jgi:hypothetical protein